ncbi:MAG: hypothetical protein ACOX2X_02140 [Peptococcia bacterium]
MKANLSSKERAATPSPPSTARSRQLGPNVTTYTDTDVGRLSQYTYRVKAVKGASSSVYSNEASASLTLRTPSVTLLR